MELTRTAKPNFYVECERTYADGYTKTIPCHLEVTLEKLYQEMFEASSQRAMELIYQEEQAKEKALMDIIRPWDYDDWDNAKGCF